MPTYWQTTKYRRAITAEIRLQQHVFRLAQSLRSMSLGSLAVGLAIARAVGVFGLRLRVVAWNNVVVGSVVFLLAIYEDYKNLESPKTVEGDRNT